jgi:BirA family biotin operon repressor/biotin-[acetyl-CoA-carboxylase] ligase
MNLSPLNIFTIKEKLETAVIGKEIRYLHRIDSTNSYALNAAMHGAKEGTIIISDEQTSGRGRHRREWKSNAYKGIYLSIILKPKTLKGEPTLLTLLSAVAVAEALKKVHPFNIDIKWPNDILINDKKASGILIEISTQSNKIMHIVIGIGVNVLQNEEDLSEIGFDQATSLYLESGSEFLREVIIVQILQSFEEWYNKLQEEGPHIILNQWKHLSSYWKGKKIKVSTIDRSFVGVTQGINEDGSLMVKKENGLMERILGGNILKIREDK